MTARRPVFGAADPRHYTAGPLPELARPGAVLALCHPPPVNPRPRLRAVEARGDPCYRCLANIAPRGSAARCGFLASERLTEATPPAPADPGDGFGL